MAVDWFRTEGWSASDRDEFETRLKRARVDNRPQYLRIKALAIEAQSPQGAEDLLRRIIGDHADH